MSDRSVEDEILAEARQFSAAMQAAMRRHAQAANWLERRRARKEISRLVRQERRETEQARAHHLSWTNQAVERYRVHAEAVAQRAIDPSVDYERRARDARSLAEHRDALAGQFVGNTHLTRTEQGIALDGLDAASVFPEYPTGNLFGRAHKVRGIEALHYRARVAREVQAQHAAAQEHSWDAAWESARQRNYEHSVLDQVAAAAPDRSRYRAQMVWTDQTGGLTVEARSLATEHTATDWMRRTLNDTAYRDGTTLHVQIEDTHATHAADRVLFAEAGHPDLVEHHVTEREAAVREWAMTGIQREANERDERLVARQPAPRAHRNETTPTVAHNEPQVATAVSGRDRAREARPAERQQAREARAEEPARNEDFARELAELRQRHGLSIEHNNDLTEANARLTRQLSTLTAELDQLRDTNSDLRDQLMAHNVREINQDTDLAALIAERDQLRGQRDEAVRKLAERTPAEQRYGSPERQAEQAKTAASASSGWSPLAGYQPGHALADAVARGSERNGVER